VVVLCLAVGSMSGAGEPSTAELEAQLATKLAERRRRTVALGASFEAAGDWPRAVRYYEAARTIRDDDVAVLTRLLRFYRTTDDVRKQVSVYEALVRLQPTSLGWLRSLGACHFRLGDRKQADAVWQRILTVHPLRTEAIAYLAQVYGQHGLHGKTAELYKEAVALAPHDADVRLRAAGAFVRGDDPLGALAVLSALTKAERQTHAARLKAARQAAFHVLEFTRGERLAAEAMLDEAPCTTAGLAWRLARAAETDGQWKQAAEFFARVAKEEPHTVRGRVAAETARRLKGKP